MSDQTRKPNRHERERRRHRRDILAAAARLFAKHGYSGTTMQMIADEAEFSVGFLYKHFPGKEALLEQILDLQMEASDRMRRRIRLTHAHSPLAVLREQIAKLCEQVGENIYLMNIIFSHEAEKPLKSSGRFERFTREDEELVQAAMECGEIRPHDPRELVAAIDGGLWGLIRHLHDTDRIDRLDEVPGLVDALILDPITLADKTDDRKDSTRS